MDKKPFFITTPIYYVNDVPHIGSAYTTVAADVYNRFLKQEGRATKFLVGSDEHGAKIAEAAEKSGKSPKEYTDEIVISFKDAWANLGIGYDHFIRTTDPEHEKTASIFLQKLYDGSFITKGVYEGLYCVGCEKFKSAEELVDGKCPDHNRAPEQYQEENYFFTLSKFQIELENLIESDKLEVRPLERKNEILGKLRQGLQDISVSRKKVEWGIPLPFDHAQTMYVWIEALINYYTYGKPNNLWPADLHLIGKDILWFHAVIWPAMLLAIGEEPPKKIFAHGFFTISGAKMSKTLGNVISPSELIQKFDVDGARYLLLSSFPFGTDGDFDWARLIEKYNADLANGIGNLASRITTLAAGIEGVVLGTDAAMSEVVSPIFKKWQAAMGELDFYGATVATQELVKICDKYLNETKPWALAEEEKRTVLKNCLAILSVIAGCSYPFMPQSMERIFSSLGLTVGTDAWGKTVLFITKNPQLFPRL